VIERIALHNIRSWSTGEVALGPGPQLLWGSNGAGKTTIVEACLVAATGRSHRAGALRELLADGAPNGSLTLTVADNDAPAGDPLARSTLSVELSRDDRARHLVDGTSRRSSALSARLRVATFVPEETALVSGGPALRRGALDRIATQWRTGYHDATTRYERALRQRNHLLKEAQADESAARALTTELDPWTALLIGAGTEIIEGRLALLDALTAPLAAAHREVAPDEPPLSVAYHSREGYTQGATREEITARFSAALRDTATNEIYQGHTLVGPHRDDATFFVGGRDMADVASRGQQRSVLLALLFAEIELLVDEKGRPPVLLLDDAFSELDPERREHLVRRIAATPQTIITTTTPADLPPALVASAAITEIRRGANGSEAQSVVNHG
jgi:DNA replication and repair protein RecF